MLKFRLYSSIEIYHILLIFHNLDVEFFCLVEFIYMRILDTLQQLIDIKEIIIKIPLYIHII